MEKSIVSVVRYESPLESVRKAVSLCDGLERLSSGSRVFIKPNIVFWTGSVPFPKWGVITTARVVCDTVEILKEHGVDDITVGEGIVLFTPKDRETPQQAFEGLGFNALKKRYGIKTVDVHAGEFRRVDLGDDVSLDFNVDFLESDFLVDLPVMKTHTQTVVSLGVKNIKGLINVNSRKKCHSTDPVKDLHFMVAKLATIVAKSLTIIDGIYSLERGPAFDGKVRRTNLLIASRDMLSADMAGAVALGYRPEEVPHLAHAIRWAGRPADLSDVEIRGESLDAVSSRHEHDFIYNEDNTLPLPMAKAGITGLSYPKYDLSLCTYCSAMSGAILTSIGMAWEGKPWDNVEVLTGKVQRHTPGKKTILIGKCVYEANKDDPEIDRMIAIKSCPPSPEAIVNALHQVGVKISPAILQNLDKAPAYFMRKYEGKPEFDESFFNVK